MFGLLPFALLLPPSIARNLLSASQVRLLAKPIPQACAGCAALTPAPRSRPLAVSSRNAQAQARIELQLSSARTISCCSRRCRPACPCRCPGVVPPRHDSLPSSLSLSPPHFDCCRAACKLQHCSRASVDIADANPQYIATASVIGLQLLQVTAPAPAALPACASRRLLRRWMPAHRGRWSPAARSGSRCTPSPPFRRVHPKSPSRTVVNVCCAAGGVGAHAHEQRQQHCDAIPRGCHSLSVY